MLAFKPWLSKLDPLQYEADLRAFGDKLAKDLVPRLEARRRRRVLAAVGPGARRARRPPAADEPREEALRRALEEIEASPDPDLVAFLLLRAARAFFPRAVLFVAKDDRLRGLAGFGPVAERREPRPARPRADRPARGRLAVRPGGGERPRVAGRDPGRRPAARARRAASAPSTPARPRSCPLRALHETIALVYGDAPDGGRSAADRAVRGLRRAGRAAPSRRRSPPAGRRSPPRADSAKIAGLMTYPARGAKPRLRPARRRVVPGRQPRCCASSSSPPAGWCRAGGTGSAAGS